MSACVPCVVRALFLTIVVAESAGAEYAWVLWLETVQMTGGGTESITTWSVQTTMPTIEACSTAGASAIKSLVRRHQLSQVHVALGIETTEELTNGVFVTYTDRKKRSNGWHRSVYHCLPDHVDPTPKAQ